MPLASARSVPGWGARCRVACSAVAVRLGSITTTAPPAALNRPRCWTNGGIVSAGLLPTSSTQSASPRSLKGNGMPRSTPKARFPAAAAEDMQKRPL